MSAALPNCVVCLSPWARDVEKLLAQGTSMKAIVRSLKSRRASAIAHRRYPADAVDEVSYDQMKEHAARCSEKTPTYIAAQDIPTPGKSPPISVSAAELADPAKRLDVLREALAAKIADLPADKLFQMYMAELRLQTAQAERDAKGASVPVTPPTPGGDDALDAAMAQAAGHMPDLRVVSSRARPRRRTA